jgi:hypothetical protein
MNTDTLLRELITAPQGSPMPKIPGWWTQISAFTSIAVSAAIIGVAVLILLKLRRQKRALLGNAATHAGRLGRRREADDRAEWIRRTQWALEAAASSNDAMYSYGAAILEAMARSDLTGPEDKAILDTVWAGSCTKMRDDEVRHLIADCRAIIEQDKHKPIPEHTLRRGLGGQRGIEDPPVSGENEATRLSRVGSSKGFDPARRDKIFAILRREILAARLKVTLDEQLGRETSPTVKHLAGMKLPPIGRPHQSGDYQAKPARPTRSSE